MENGSVESLEGNSETKNEEEDIKIMSKDDGVIESQQDRIEVSRINSPSRSQSRADAFFSPIQDKQNQQVLTELYRAAAQAYFQSPEK